MPVRPRLRRASVLALLGVALGCGETPTERGGNPIPVLLGVSPERIPVGTPGATLTLTGESFVPGATVFWKNTELPTRVVSATELHVDLRPSDLEVMGTGKLKVQNPKPGGGSSGLLTFGVGNPQPGLTSITPSDVPIHATNTVLTFTGTGFVKESQVWTEGPWPTRYISPTQVEATLPDSYEASTLYYSVFNPEPLGGMSNRLALEVRNPLPVVTGLTPDTVVAGLPATMSVLGTGFVRGTVVRWNGVDRPTSYYDGKRLNFTISVAMAAEGTAQVTVHSPGPGGGTSNAVAVDVRLPSPVITSTAPTTLLAGSGSTTITLLGRNFRPGVSVHWNGQPRPTQFLFPGTLTVDVTAADLASAGTAQVMAINPGPRASAVASLPIMPAALAAGAPVVVELRNNHLVFDPVRSVFYASVPGSVSGRGNTITKIDVQGNILASVPVGVGPGRMAIADDASTLYVILDSSSAVARVNLATFTKDLEIALGTSFMWPGIPVYGGDIEVLTGAPNTVAITLMNRCCGPAFEALAIYDGGVRRPKVITYPLIDRITRSDSPLVLYGFTSNLSSFEIHRVQAAQEGPSVTAGREGLVEGFFSDLEFDRGLLFFTTGAVVDPAAFVRVGTLPATGIVRPDVAQGRVHFLSGVSIRTYHYSAYTLFGTFEHASLAGLNTLVRWQNDGIAAGGGERISIVRGTLFGN